jgi:hypothetical protein
MGEVALSPGGEGKDARLDSYYTTSNYGTYTYLTYCYYYPYTYYQENNGLIEFDEDQFPTEQDENGIDRVNFRLTIHNVEPVLDMSEAKFRLEDGTIVDKVKEGDKFEIINVKFNDPAAKYATEVFEYKVDFGQGPSPWTPVTPSVTPHIVVPNDHETTYGNYNNRYPLLPVNCLRYQQLYDASQFGATTRSIVALKFRMYTGSLS